MKKTTQTTKKQPTPKTATPKIVVKRKKGGGAKVRRVTITFYPDKKSRDRLICYFLDRKGVSTSEALHSTLLECALQTAREMAKEVYHLPDSNIKYLTPSQLLTILSGEWGSDQRTTRPVLETPNFPENMCVQPQTKKGGIGNEKGDDDFDINDV